MLKKEACTASKAGDRISAINSLARLTGMELPTVDKQSSTPVINITLNGMAPASSPPVINVTPRPEALLGATQSTSPSPLARRRPSRP